jgi:WD40 repeat protein
MSHDEPTNGGEMITASGGVPGHRAKGLIARIDRDLRASINRAISREESTELQLSASWRCRATLRGHTDSVICLALGRNGEVLASGGCDGTVRLWRLPQGILINTMQHTAIESDNVECLAISRDDRLLISGGLLGPVRMWSLPNGEPLKTLDVKSEVWCMSVSPDGELLVASSGAVLYIVRLPDGMTIRTLEGHPWEVSCLAISPDGRLLASGDWSGCVRLWELPEGRFLRALEGTIGWVKSLIISHDSQLLICGGDRGVFIWTLPDGKVQQLASDKFEDLAMSPDGRLLAGGMHDPAISLWSLPDGKALQKLEGHETFCVSNLVMSPDGRLLASGGGGGGIYSGGRTDNDQSLHLWRLPEGKAIATLEGHTKSISDLAMTPDSRILVSASYDGTVRLWESY